MSYKESSYVKTWANWQTGWTAVLTTSFAERPILALPKKGDPHPDMPAMTAIEDAQVIEFPIVARAWPFGRKRVIGTRWSAITVYRLEPTTVRMPQSDGSVACVRGGEVIGIIWPASKAAVSGTGNFSGTATGTISYRGAQPTSDAIPPKPKTPGEHIVDGFNAGIYPTLRVFVAAIDAEIAATKKQALTDILVCLAGQRICTPLEGYRNLEHALSDIRRALQNARQEQREKDAQIAADVLKDRYDSSVPPPAAMRDLVAAIEERILTSK